MAITNLWLHVFTLLHTILNMEKTLVILHGWASKLENWDNFVLLMEKEGFSVYLPSLPGFGKKRLKKAWDLNNYVNWFKKWLKKEKIDKFYLLGHSFGGRMAIKYAAGKPKELKKLILVNSAGFEKKLTFKKIIFLIFAKIGKILFFFPPLSFFKKGAKWLLYELAREKDYYKADDVLKKTMQKVIMQNLENEIGKIDADTLIVWGAKDNITPLKWASILKKGIAKSKILVYDNSKHDLPFTKSEQLKIDILNFLKND